MGNMLQLKITLKGVKPRVWRRILVSDFWSFDKLHKIIQKAMGWENYHLYEFVIDGEKITIPEEGYPLEIGLANSKSKRIYEFSIDVGTRFSYLYDFGDNWEHEVIVEKVFEDSRSEVIPRCIDGKGDCPREDSRFGLEECNGDFVEFDICGVNKELGRHAGFG